MSAAELADTLPPIKQCGCGVAYDADSWRALQLAGYQNDGDGGVLELRHCTCSSTIAIELPRRTTR